jgi:hypothetical protein
MSTYAYLSSEVDPILGPVVQRLSEEMPHGEENIREAIARLALSVNRPTATLNQAFLFIKPHNCLPNSARSMLTSMAQLSRGGVRLTPRLRSRRQSALFYPRPAERGKMHQQTRRNLLANKTPRQGCNSLVVRVCPVPHPSTNRCTSAGPPAGEAGRPGEAGGGEGSE